MSAFLTKQILELVGSILKQLCDSSSTNHSENEYGFNFPNQTKNLKVASCTSYCIWQCMFKWIKWKVTRSNRYFENACFLSKVLPFLFTAKSFRGPVLFHLHICEERLNNSRLDTIDAHGLKIKQEGPWGFCQIFGERMKGNTFLGTPLSHPSF